MNEKNFFIVVGKAPGPEVEVVKCSDVEPTDEQLAQLWNELDLQVYPNIGGSDLIQVFASEQMQEAYQVNSPSIGQILQPNRFSEEDAINAYWGELE